MRRTFLAVGIAWAMWAAPVVALPRGAVIDETVASVLHVDGGSPGADDAGPGTLSQPLKTIGAAVNRALASRAQGLGTKVLVHPGTYRERVLPYAAWPGWRRPR